MTKYDPTPQLRWLQRVVPVTNSSGYQDERVLQVGFRPIGGGPVEWSDVPVIFDSAQERAAAALAQAAQGDANAH